MLRRALPVVLVVFALAGLAIASRVGGNAQEGTQAAAPSAQRLASAEPSNAPGKALVLSRVTFPPGSAIPLHTHPGVTLLVVESGAFGITVASGPAVVTRATVEGTPGASEELTPNVEAILGPGDAFFEDAGAMHTARNASDGETVVTVTQLLEVGQPGLIPVIATPTA